MMNNLFEINYKRKQPLAYRIRPTTLAEFFGQKNIIAEGSPLRELIKKQKFINSIFYGESGTGKTTLAEIIAKELKFYFVKLNATNCSISDIKKISEESEKRLKIEGKETLLFLDEIHRFNKLQQDSLLSFIEEGIFKIIAATTENPFYNLNNALLSRCLSFKFEKLKKNDIISIINRAEEIEQIKIENEIKEFIVETSNGDARIALNYLELILEVYDNIDKNELKKIIITEEFFHKKEDKYNLISAMIKSIRGSDPDASVYWLGRLLKGGEDPRYIARRLVILAAEDIGLANPEALNLSTSAYIASEKIGMPEIRIILSEVVIYLAISSKSNSVYNAINSVFQDLESEETLEVPKYLTKEYSKNYKYPHNYDNNFVKQDYLKKNKRFYIPGNNRMENKIKEKLIKLWGKKYGK
ncbi:putative ATPase [Hypnocyclicus thermotrophus]|uniref:ATPase n=1 Tax=Hypnocyclicus thermotrophus TaxID=1627895 RepID=A0AA46DXT5_9FUSO|nr:replication-associated recombination protein A [Hypnocyclicus thermotrophus]TDT68578.1 putative ATPase [Hypnocyclicus thermotrophus]